MDLTLDPELSELSSAVGQLLRSPVGQQAKFGSPLPPLANRKALIGALEDLVLASLGDLSDHTSALAAATVSRECGAAASAIPVCSLVVARAARRDGILAAVDERESSAAIMGGDLGVPAQAVTVSGALSNLKWTGAHGSTAYSLVPGGAASLSPAGEVVDPWHWGLHLTLSAFGALGACEAVLNLTISYIKSRTQFGQAIADFQLARGRVAEMTVAVHGLRELCYWTLWRIYAVREKAAIDSLVLRFQELSVLKGVFRNAHQLHGAMGFCLEYPLAYLTLSQLAERHVPLTEARCIDLLIEHYRDIDLHYEELPPAWPVMRSNKVSSRGGTSRARLASGA